MNGCNKTRALENYFKKPALHWLPKLKASVTNASAVRLNSLPGVHNTSTGHGG